MLPFAFFIYYCLTKQPHFMIHIESAGNKTIINFNVKRANLFFKSILIFLIGVPIVLMLLALVLSDKIKSPFAFFIGFLIFGLVSFFLFRLLLWNTYGKEIYTISKNEFTAINDYGWFKDNNRIISGYNEIAVMYSPVEKPHELNTLNRNSYFDKKIDYVISFYIDEEPFVSVVKVHAADLEKFSTEIETLIQ